MSRNYTSLIIPHERIRPVADEATADALLWKPRGNNAGGWNEAVIDPLPLTEDLLNNAQQIQIK